MHGEGSYVAASGAKYRVSIIHCRQRGWSRASIDDATCPMLLALPLVRGRVLKRRYSWGVLLLLSQGAFFRGKYDGQGTYEWADGAQYTGSWKAGL
jgi:hypothetical protein